MNASENTICDYDSIEETINDEHLVHFPEPFDFELDKNYDYLREGLIDTLWYHIIRTVADIILNIYNRLAFGLKINGFENLKVSLNRGGVIVCNHVHMLDCTFIDCVFPLKRVYYTTLESNFKIPIARHLIRWLGGVPIPTKVHNIQTFMNQMQNALIDGKLVCMYPEGILNPYYKDLRRFKDGAFKIAINAQRPVIPLVITFREPDGLFKFFKKKPCVTLNILPPIMPELEGNNRKNTQKLKNMCYNEMNKVISDPNYQLAYKKEYVNT